MKISCKKSHGFLYYLVFEDANKNLQVKISIFRLRFASDNFARFSYRVFIKNCVFSLKFCDFSELCQFYLPGVCTHTDMEGKPQSGIF